MTEELESLKKVTGKLNTGKFDYFLTGSMAMSFYSVPRMTRDADIVIQLYEKDTEKFLDLFLEDYYIDKDGLKDSVKNKMIFNIFDKKSFFKIDFILKNNNEFEEMTFQRKKKIKINSLEVHVISIEDLIISKLNWAKDSHSELQFNDVRQLMKNEYDVKYLLDWISKLNLNDVYKRI